MRKLLFGLVGLIVVVIGAALIVPSFIDWNGYKAEIAAQARQATGRDLQIIGDLDLAILPSPRLSANDVKFANLTGATAPYMAELKSLQVSIRLAPLLSGNIEVESVSLINPTIELERLPDGRANWELGKAEKPSAAASGATKAAMPDAQSQAIRLNSLRIEGGSIIYRDAAKEIVERIENLDLEISAQSLAGPFEIDGGLTASGIALKIAASVGKISGPRAAALKISLNIPEAQSEIKISGSLNDLRAATRIKGKISAKGPDLGKLIAAIAPAAGGASAGILAQPFSLKAQVDASAKVVAIDGIALDFGGTHANGGVNAVLGEKTQADIALRIGRIDLDKILAMNPASGSKDSAAADGPTAEPETPGKQAGFSLPKNINGTLDFGVDAATYKGGQIRGIKFAASLNDGELTVNQATARLPGGAEVSLFGFLTASKGQPNFDGSVDIRADNLRAVMNWWKIDTASVPADRLRKFGFAAKVTGNPDQIQISKIKMKLDASRISGGVTYALGRARPGFGARFRVDQLNLDAYAPADDNQAISPSPQSGAAAQGAAKPAASPLKFLTEFDANLNLRIGTLNFRRTPIQGIRISSTLFNGKLGIREARIRSLAGAAISIKGSVEGFSGLPVFKGSFAADSQDISGLTRVLNIKTPVPAKRYGRLKLNGRADAAADKIIIKSNLQLAGARVTLNGTLDNLQKSPRFDLTLAANHPEFSRLAPLLGAGLAPGKRRYGLFGFSGQVKGDINAVEIDAKVTAAGAKIALAGRITDPVAEAKIDASFHFLHPSLTGLMRTLNPDYRPARAKLGPVKLATQIKGDEKAVDLQSLRGAIGPLQIEGDGRLAFDGAKPKLTASLASSEIDLNLLLPADAAGAAPNGPGAVIGAPAAAVKGAAHGR
ncbi:MAG: AsmA family protein, partial [Pseudomonadota bacterium]|nr:AsmA family protein [Pseudomonadota bacterium]